MIKNHNKRYTDMRKLSIYITICISLLFGNKVTGQTYTIDTEGTVNTCGGTFYDSGGSGGSYSNNENHTMTFCSDQPGDEIQFDFTLFDIEGGYDYLYIYDGPDNASPQIAGSPFSAASPGTVQSTSGCLTFVFESDTYVSDPGWAATISCITPTCSDGIQNQGEVAVDCGGPCPVCTDFTIDMGGNVSVCNGTFYDSGGSGGSYSNSEYHTMTFCSDQPGDEIQFDFSVWNLEGCCDHLTIYDGSTTTAPQIYYGDGGDPSPGIVQSTNGCLTFVFDSDGSVTDPGWEATISCFVPCDISSITAGTQTACDQLTNEYTQEVTVTYSNAPATGNLVVNGQSFPITSSPQTVTLTGLTSNGTGVDVTASFSDDASCITTNTNLFTAPADCGPQDCENAILVCSNNTFNGSAVDYGDVYEINDPVNTECDMNSENQSTWFYVNIGTSGTLEMTIDPANGTDDYDWAIWGPYTSSSAAANCPPIEPPLRCNTSANTPLTGMNTTASNNYEYPGTSTYEWSNPINATAGDIYIMMIDNWSASGNPFTLDWGGTAGLSCTSVVLPITLMDFNGENNGNHNHLFWSTKSEKDNDYFIVEYSPSGTNWSTIDIVSGAGTTTMIQNYSTTHRDYKTGVNYYRLSQVDFNGDITKHKVISIDNNEDRTLIKRVNTMGQEVTKDYRGLVILYFNDGSIKKILQ